MKCTSPHPRAIACNTRELETDSYQSEVHGAAVLADSHSTPNLEVS